MQVTHLLLLTALVLGEGASPTWAGLPISNGSTPGAQTAPTPGQKMAPGRPAKTPAPRKDTTGSSSSSSLAAGKRDPFKLPEAAAAPNKGAAENVLESAPGGVLPLGNRGLLISQLTLEGIVREQTSNKMIAVVTNATKVAHFLHENDSVYNGIVSKITPDAVYFKENVLDADGRVTTREVVKRLSSAPGEGR